MQNAKRLNLALILTSLLGYLEWGTDQQMFLWQGEIEVIIKLFTVPRSVLHPLTLLPLVGQILLLITLFQKSPSRTLTWVGLAGLSVLLVLLFAVGAISLNIKTVLSTAPFLVVAALTVHQLRTAAHASDATEKTSA